MKFLRKLSFPIAFFYWIAVVIRNKFFDAEFLKSRSFPIPTIAVGNLSVGGTGKTPIVEYLIRLLKDDFKLATLSRGYGRKSKGYVQASALSSPDEIGDEPTQFKQKFNEISVVVCEDRCLALDRMDNEYDVVILDDAFQHRHVKPGLSILLFDYNKVFEFDWMLPFGNLREPKRGMKRAEIIIVTKTSKIFSPMERRRVESKINPQTHQQLFFSYLKYADLVGMSMHAKPRSLGDLDRKTRVILLTGIADASLLKAYLESNKLKNIVHLNYPDHHNYTLRDLERLKSEYAAIHNENKIIITTEKDAMRLKHPRLETHLKDTPVYYLPIEAELHEKDKEKFDKVIVEYVRTNQSHH